MDAVGAAAERLGSLLRTLGNIRSSAGVTTHCVFLPPEPYLIQKKIMDAIRNDAEPVFHSVSLSDA